MPGNPMQTLGVNLCSQTVRQSSKLVPAKSKHFFIYLYQLSNIIIFSSIYSIKNVFRNDDGHMYIGKDFHNYFFRFMYAKHICVIYLF